ncbi:MAG: DinB family protein [Gemmatimonadales bacterium]
MVHRALVTLLKELGYGAGPGECWVLNRNDSGLLRSLDRLSAEAASAAPPTGGTSIAAHVDHLRFGFELLNRYTRGEDAFASADYSASWRRGNVSEPEWVSLRRALSDQLERWIQFLAEPREYNEFELTGALASVTHLAYHIGAMRQIDRSMRGPAAIP